MIGRDETIRVPSSLRRPRSSNRIERFRPNLVRKRITWMGVPTVQFPSTTRYWAWAWHYNDSSPPGHYHCHHHLIVILIFFQQVASIAGQRRHRYHRYFATLVPRHFTSGRTNDDKSCLYLVWIGVKPAVKKGHNNRNKCITRFILPIRRNFWWSAESWELIYRNIKSFVPMWRAVATLN